MSVIHAVLFDLDGTLADTAPDFVYVLNLMRKERELPALATEVIRPIANLGSKAMIKRAFDMDESDPDYDHVRKQFLSLYFKHLAIYTQLFPNIDKVLLHLEQRNIPWGIVTNKPSLHTLELLRALELKERAKCIVCGDTLPKNKPDPLPLLYACKQLSVNPEYCLYVGDAETDVIASKAAKMRSLVALYGYINVGDNPLSWKADGYVKEPDEIIEWLSLS